MGAGSNLASCKALQPYCDAEAWLQQGEYLAIRGTYGPAKVHAYALCTIHENMRI